jgi:hypothetical protein
MTRGGQRPSSGRSGVVVGDQTRSTASGRSARALPPNAKNPWVSKSAFRLYLRCPYAFFQIDSGLVTREAMIDELGEQLIADGIAFEQSVVSAAVPLPPDVDFREALAGDVPLYGLSLLRNDKLKIFGIPDDIDPRSRTCRRSARSLAPQDPRRAGRPRSPLVIASIGPFADSRIRGEQHSDHSRVHCSRNGTGSSPATALTRRAWLSSQMP